MDSIQGIDHKARAHCEILPQDFCEKVGIMMISTATYYRYLVHVVYKWLYEFWLRDQAKTINQILVFIILSYYQFILTKL